MQLNGEVLYVADIGSFELAAEGVGNALTHAFVSQPASAELYLRRDVLRMLSFRRERQAADRACIGKAWADSGLVFTTSLGTARNLSRLFKRLTRDAKLREIHTYASLTLQRGTPLEVVSERLGHSSVGRHL